MHCKTFKSYTWIELNERLFWLQKQKEDLEISYNIRLLYFIMPIQMNNNMRHSFCVQWLKEGLRL